jgi:hypothetical protein
MVRSSQNEKRGRLGADVVAEAGAAARVGREQPAHQADGRRLAAAVGTEEAEDLAPFDPKRQVDHDMLVPEALVEAVDVDHRRAGAGIAFGIDRCGHGAHGRRTFTG